MRKSIRLTGRKQLAISDFDFQLRDVGGKQVATLTVDRGASQSLPADALVRVKLVENKRVSVLRFGSISEPKLDFDVGETPFRAPSCQVRIVKAGDPDGLLIGSTSTWTYKTDGAQEGILQFQSFDIAPRLWKLELRDQEYPIVYVDQQVPDAAAWAGTSPIFGALVFPTVVREVFRKIADQSAGARPDDGWMADWIGWAENLAPGDAMPLGAEDEELGNWCDSVVDAFLRRHGVASKAISELSK